MFFQCLVALVLCFACVSSASVMPAALQDGAEDCEFCQEFFENLEEAFSKHKKDVVDGLNNLCAYHPENYTIQCQAFMKNYADNIADLIVKVLDPTEGCANIKACTSSKSPTAHLGVKKVLDVFPRGLNLAINKFVQGYADKKKSTAGSNVAVVAQPETLPKTTSAKQ